MSVPLLRFFLYPFCSAKTEWAGEKRELKRKHQQLEEAEAKIKEELLGAMVNSSQAIVGGGNSCHPQRVHRLLRFWHGASRT